MRVDRGRGMQGSGKSESGNGGISYLITNKYSTRPKVTLPCWRRRPRRTRSWTYVTKTLSHKPTHTTPATSHTHRRLIRFLVSRTVTHCNLLVCCLVHQLSFLSLSLSLSVLFVSCWGTGQGPRNKINPTAWHDEAQDVKRRKEAGYKILRYF